ncbi:MAG: hypothetical protein OEW19_21610, partial [Acidobacteriota bacterium]|nr:hypothetical protein [Acidobacteriota bacterium]
MTPEEQLDYEARMARVLEIRQPGRRGSSLQIWLNSTVLSALVGVAGTALLGAYVSGKIQERSKLNEMEVVERQETRAARAA